MPMTSTTAWSMNACLFDQIPVTSRFDAPFGIDRLVLSFHRSA